MNDPKEVTPMTVTEAAIAQTEDHAKTTFPGNLAMIWPEYLLRLCAQARQANALQAELAALKAGWRPISEAPRDGTWVTGWAKNWSRPYAIQCIRGLWYHEDGEDAGAPTHFQPLPAPPQG